MGRGGWDDPPCARNARPQKSRRGSSQTILRARRTRTKDSLAAPLRAKWGKTEGPRLGNWHVSACQWVGG